MTATDLLRIFRAQTAAVEGAGFPLSAYLGGAPLWMLPFFALLGILAHFGGFGENSISDIEYDKLDPSKKDHPIVAGRVKSSVAGAWVIMCQLLGILGFLAVLETRLPPIGWVLPGGLFLGYILLGHAYNYLGKRNKPLAVLEISGSFALAFLALGSVWTGHLTTLLWWVGAYAFAFVAFQIAISGEAKEIRQANESNLLRRLGGGVWMSGNEEWFAPGAGGFTLAFALAMAKVVTIIVVAILVSREFAYVVVPVAVVAFVGYAVVLLTPRPFDRTRMLKIMGMGEAVSYLVLVLAVAPSLGPWVSMAFVVLPVAWFAALNRVLWARTGSAWAPGV